MKEGAKDDASKTDDQGNNYWELDRNRRVSLSSFKGKQYLNIREYYQDKASGEEMRGNLQKYFIATVLVLGQWRPGKSGITLTKNEWTQLLALQPSIKFEG